jgi:histidinol-phosphate aminotransferase
VSQESPRFRALLDEFAPYQPGRRVVGPDGRSHKLSSNETPFGPLPSVLKVIAEAAGDVHR